MRRLNESGQALLEYALLSALIASVCVGTLGFLGKQVSHHGFCEVEKSAFGTGHEHWCRLYGQK